MESIDPKSKQDENIQLEPSTILTNNLDINRPYLVYIQDQNNVSTHVIVFSKGLRIKLDKVDSSIIPIYSSMEIHFDDSIHVIKKKILRELKENQIDAVYDEMYLYAYTKQIYTLNSLFLSLLNAGNDSISKNTMLDLAARMNIQIGDSMSENIKFEEFEKILSDTNQDIYIKSALGIVFSGDNALTNASGFDSDPFLYKSMNMQQREKIENNMKMMDNSLLLNSNKIADNCIYLCLASTVLSHIEKEADQQEVISLYYKYLYHRSIRTKQQLIQQYGELKKETDKMLDLKMFHVYDSIQLLYDIHKNKTKELEYEERGIKNLTFRIKSNYNIVLPLDLVFRNIHASKMIPFIKFNPGNRRENLYRIYFEHLSKTGKKIPYLDAKTILRLSRDIGKLKQIAIYTEQYIDGVKYQFQLNIESGGGLVVVCDFATGVAAKSKESIVDILKQNINPVIHQLNGFLKQTGFAIDMIVSLEQMSIEILDMQWYARIVQSGNLKEKTLNCMRAVFDIKDDEPKNNLENIVMNYIRVENYVEMSREDSYISKRYRSDLDIQAIPDIIHGLVSQFGFSLDDAKIKMVDYLNTHGYVSGAIVENAGFTSSLRVLKQIRNSFEFKVENITSIHYLPCIEIYVDSIIRLIQDVKSTGIDKSLIDQTCKISKSVVEKTRKTEIVEMQKRTDAVEIKEEGAIKRPRPIQFIGNDLAFDLDDEGDIAETMREIIGDSGEVDDNDDDANEEDDLLLLDEFTESMESDIVDDKSSTSTESEIGDDQIGEDEIKNSIVGDDVDVVDEFVESRPVMGTPPRSKSLSVDSIDTTGTEKGLFYESSPEDEARSSKPDDSSASFCNENPEMCKVNMVENVDADEDADEDDLLLDESEPSSSVENEKNDNLRGGDESPNVFKSSPTGMALQPSPFLKRMVARDSALFKIKNKGDSEYARTCQPIGRYPVSITKEEKDRIDRENPGSYSSSLEYGSSEAKKNYYICPRFWCFLTDSSITEDDVKAGKCGKIIPDKPPGNKIPEGHYVYEFKRKNPFNKDGKYVDHRPGLFEIEGREHKLPCCYKTGSVENELQKAVVKDTASTAIGEGRQANYIIKMESYPIDRDRWGYLPITAQFFLNVNYSEAIDKHNPSYILPNAPVLLRYGIEKNETQSFLALMAEIVAYKQGLAKTPTVAQFKEILLREISLDIFVKIHNASLITSFQPDIEDAALPSNEEYTSLKSTSQFLEAIDETNEKQKTFANNAIMAYLNFQKYIKNDSIEIDHSYLWSIITSDIPSLVKGGLNLILLNRVENDITPHIGLVCPTIFSTKQLYDPKKESILVIKQDMFYEPIYLYELLESSGKPVIRKTFSDKTMNKNIHHVLENIKNVSNRYCAPIPSLPRVYEFTTPMRMDEIIDECANIGFKCIEQIMNFQGKIIGLIMSGGGIAATFVPCYPAMPIPGIPTKYMDSLDIWSDYDTTKQALTKINNETGRKVKCAIRLKVVDGGLIVGFITETNQFVQINPPSENIHDDGIETYENPNMNAVDTEITTTLSEDKERTERIKMIELETEFYYRFKSLSRELINDYRNYSAKMEIMKLVQPEDVDELEKTTYKEKLERVESILRRIVEPRVIFEEIDDAVLDDFNSIQCQEKDNRQFCLNTENSDGSSSKMILPKWHLYAAKMRSLDNSKIYFARMADELVRNERARLFMMNQKKYLNVKNLNYLVNPDEFIIIQSALIGDYLKNLDVAFARNEYLRNVNYDNAHPAITQQYTNQVRLDEQIVAKEEAEKRILKYQVREVIGNDRVIWKRIFKHNYQEHVYGEDSGGAYNLMIRVFEESMVGKGIPEIGVGVGEKMNMYHINQLLWSAYAKYMDGDEPPKKLMLILSKQGKSALMGGVIAGKIKLNELIFSGKYTLSDLDIWILSATYGLPVIMFNPNGLKGYPFSGNGNTKITWIKMGGKINDAFFFIRSMMDSTINKVSTYNLISPSCKLNELSEFNDVIRDAIQGDTEYKYNVLPFSKLME